MSREEKKKRTKEVNQEMQQAIKSTLSNIDDRFDGRNDKTSKYSEEEILNAVNLYRIYQSLSKVSTETGIPQQTIKQWVNGSVKVLSKIGNFETKLEDSYNQLMQNSEYLMRKAQQVINEKLPDSSAAQAATIYGILFDKHRIMATHGNEQTTSNLIINPADLSQDEQSALLQRVLQRKQEAEAIEAEYTVADTDTDTDTDTE